VSDYLSCNEELKPFYSHPVSLGGIQASIKARQAFTNDRRLLVNELRNQYQGIPFSPKQEAYLASLLSENTFTITTAHQPNIFTGPLYFIYKIIHTIKLADELKVQLPEYNFVPVYYMGSEDADLDELGYLVLNQQKITWQTKQTGAVGRMKVDKEFIKLIEAIAGQIGIYTYGNELADLFKHCYTEGKSIQQATLELVNALFADLGLLIVIPDNAALKQSFHRIIEKELSAQFSHQAVAQTIKALGKHYKVQTGGRELNLFYLFEDQRERIELVETNHQPSDTKLQDTRLSIKDAITEGIMVKNEQAKFMIKRAKINKEWTEQEILEELAAHPERFSANVILRGVFQETILPNIAFIGGGGELAYWLELKQVFNAAQVPYPMLILRNSFLVMQKAQENLLTKMGFTLNDLFKTQEELLNELVKKESHHQLNLVHELADLNKLYEQMKTIAGAIDPTLKNHTAALQKKAFKQLHALEKKMISAEKRKYDTEKRQITKLKETLFPNNSLQERVDNFSIPYAQSGKAWLELIYNASKGLAQQFGIIIIN